MHSIHSLIPFNRLKLGRPVAFMKYLASVVSLISLPKTLIWNEIAFSGIRFAEFFRAGGRLVYEGYLQKLLEIFFLLFSLSLLIVKVLRAYD